MRILIANVNTTEAITDAIAEQAVRWLRPAPK